MTLKMSQSRERLIKQLSSSIFSTLSEEIKFRPKKRLARDSSLEGFSHGSRRCDTPTSVMLKPLDHTANDFFGNAPQDFYKKNLQGFYSSFCKQRIQKKLKETDFSAAKAESNSIKPAKNENFTQNKEKTFNNEAKLSERLIPKPVSKIPVLPKPEDARIETLQIKGLKPEDDEMTIKQMCKGIHIIGIHADIDNVTGNCLGTAKLKVRSYPSSSEIEKLKLNFVEKGLEVSYISLSKGKKNNYFPTNMDFLDSQLQQEEKRL